jgi:hypothetical protein
MHSGTLVTHAPTTIAATVADQLRSAITALEQLRDRWLPKLATAARDQRIPSPSTLIRARRALRQIEDGATRATSLEPHERTAEVDHLLAVVTAEHDALAPAIAALVVRAHESCARPDQPPDPARQRAVTVEWVAGPPAAALRRHG